MTNTDNHAERIARAEERIAGLRKSEDNMVDRVKSLEDQLSKALSDAEDAMTWITETKASKTENNLMTKGAILTSAAGIIVLVVDRLFLV